MPHLIAVLFVLIGGLTASNLFVLAHDWYFVGYGLHPLLAIPTGIYMLLLPLLSFTWTVEQLSDLFGPPSEG